MKKNIYKISTIYASDKNKVARAIFNIDEKAEYRHKDRWTFKVKTTLTLNDMNRIFMYKNYECDIRKSWFF